MQDPAMTMMPWRMSRAANQISKDTEAVVPGQMQRAVTLARRVKTAAVVVGMEAERKSTHLVHSTTLDWRQWVHARAGAGGVQSTTKRGYAEKICILASREHMTDMIPAGLASYRPKIAS